MERTSELRRKQFIIVTAEKNSGDGALMQEPEIFNVHIAKQKIIQRFLFQYFFDEQSLEEKNVDPGFLIIDFQKFVDDEANKASGIDRKIVASTRVEDLIMVCSYNYSLSLKLVRDLPLNTSSGNFEEAYGQLRKWFRINRTLREAILTPNTKPEDNKIIALPRPIQDKSPVA